MYQQGNEVAMIYIVKNGEFESVRSRKVVKQAKNVDNNQRKFLGPISSGDQDSLERRPQHLRNQSIVNQKIRLS